MIIAFRYGDSRWLSRILAWWQLADVSHCEVVLGGIGDAFRCASSSWVDGGVRVMVNDLPSTKWRLYEVPGEADFAAWWAAANDGCGYDWLGLVGHVFRPVRGLADAYTCTEAVASMMKLPDPWRFDVADLESMCQVIGRRVQ